MNNLSQTVLQTKAFQSWRLVLMAVILLAAATTSGLYMGTVQAQSSRGAITGLTLASDAPGTLTVSWEAASPVPTDYRVDWAKSDEDYQSWKVDEGHKYPTPTATAATITDLDHDTEYKIRMRARYYRGEHEGKSWGGPWATDTITVAGEPAETPTPEPAEEEPAEEEPVQQPPRDDPSPKDTTPEDTTPAAGTIETLTATDDDAGQLVLSWTAPAAPNADPTDYHVNWAKSTEEYPADTAEAGNAHPTTTTHTLAGLEYDTDYNVRVRARYSNGDHAASPWNGPWTETTAQVKLPLPAAPTMGATAVSPDGDVLLTWFNFEENDSITGYQILRGPDADNMVVIEDDTGSSSTSYTDTAPPAGQTHSYGVKARNASGLSPLSNTITATVPVAEEEEELITARHEETESTLFEKGELVTSHSFGSGPSQGRAIWSDEETIWITRTTATARLVDRVADTDGRADAYGLSDMARQPEKDIRAMYGALNHHAHGIWSDGQTMWVSDDDRATIFAYSLQSDNYGNRLRTKEFHTYIKASRNGRLYADLRGLWSDGTHMWVADSRVKKIVAYTLGGQRNADLDLNLLDGVGNDGPTDIWSNGYTMWVADYRDKKIYAYRLSDGVRQPGLDYNNLESAGNVSPTGIWSNGKLMYVYDNSKNTLYSYRSLAPFPSLASLSLVSGTDAVDIGTFNAFDLEYSARLGRSISQVTVNYSAASDVGVEVGPPDADPNAPGHQVDLALTTGSYEEATEITVTATQDGETTTYGVRVTRVDVDAISNDATLSSLSLVDVNLGTFDSANLSYEAVVASSLTQTTVSLTTADPGARDLISPSDADDVATGHQVDLAVGLNEITIEVTASDAEKTTRRYVVALVRPSESEFGWLVSPDFTDLSPSNGAVRAIWSNGTTMWATFSGGRFRSDDTLRAYDLDTKARLGDRDIVDYWIGYANGIWSDGEVVAVSETQSHRIYVYGLNSGGHRWDLAFRLDSSNHNSHGLWSDGATLWVVDHADDKLYAYHWRGENPGDRRPELDFALTDGNGRGAGLWSDGTTMWVSDGEDAKIYAYSLDSATYGLRVPALDFNELAPHGNASPNGIWSNGSVMWVADDEDNRLYSYKMPALPSLASLSLSGIEFGPFRSWQSKYAVRVPVGGPSVTTVSAVATNVDQFDVKIAPSDSDALTDGHQVELATGTPQTIAVTVTKKTDPCVSRTYTLRVKLAVSGPAS